MQLDRHPSSALTFPREWPRISPVPLQPHLPVGNHQPTHMPACWTVQGRAYTTLHARYRPAGTSPRSSSPGTALCPSCPHLFSMCLLPATACQSSPPQPVHSPSAFTCPSSCSVWRRDISGQRERKQAAGRHSLSEVICWKRGFQK